MGARSLHKMRLTYIQEMYSIECASAVLYCSSHRFSSLGSWQSIDIQSFPVGPIFVTPYGAVPEGDVTSLGRPVLLGRNMQYRSPGRIHYTSYFIPFYPNLHPIFSTTLV